MKILGIDPSPQHTGLFLGKFLNGELVKYIEHGYIETQTWRDIKGYIAAIPQDTVIGIEKMFIPKQVGDDTTVALIESAGFWKYEAWSQDFIVHSIAISKWRKLAWGKSESPSGLWKSKDAKIRAEAFLKEQGISAPHHVGEAGGIALAVARMLQAEENIS